MESWVQVTVDVDEHAVELASALLFQAGASGVEVRDRTTFESARRALSEGRARALAYFGSESPESLVLRLGAAARQWAVEIHAIDAEPFTDESWKTNWKRFFVPIHVSSRLVITPPWIELDVEPGAAKVIIEPGLAFGTGSHATTRLTLEAIDARFEAPHPPASVLDVGCGSGVLCIAAAMRGGGQVSVQALDVDPEARRVARENIALNGVEGQVSMIDGRLDEVEGTYDLVVANILAHVLMFLADDLVRCTARGGVLLLCGIGDSSLEATTRAFLDRGMVHLSPPRSLEGWNALELGHGDT